MHLLKSTASSIRAGRAAQHHVHSSFQYAFGCARGLLADASLVEDALIFKADPSNAAVNAKRINKKQRTTNKEHLCHHRIVATTLLRGFALRVTPLLYTNQ